MYTDQQAQIAMDKLRTRTVQHFLDLEWHIAVEEILRDNPAGVAFAVEPAVCGQWAAEHGLPCDPAKYGYRKTSDCEDFIIAWRDTTELWAEIVEAENAKCSPEQDTIDFVESLLDEEFWRRGEY